MVIEPYGYGLTVIHDHTRRQCDFAASGSVKLDRRHRFGLMKPEHVLQQELGGSCGTPLEHLLQLTGIPQHVQTILAADRGAKSAGVTGHGLRHGFDRSFDSRSHVCQVSLHNRCTDVSPNTIHRKALEHARSAHVGIQNYGRPEHAPA